MLHDHYVVQKMQHFNRERVPERVVHAKGTGAHGVFEVTNDVTQFTKADLLSAVGKQTPMFARFSTVAGEQGFADTVRDPGASRAPRSGATPTPSTPRTTTSARRARSCAT